MLWFPAEEWKHLPKKEIHSEFAKFETNSCSRANKNKKHVAGGTMYVCLIVVQQSAIRLPNSKEFDHDSGKGGE